MNSNKSLELRHPESAMAKLVNSSGELYEAVLIDLAKDSLSEEEAALVQEQLQISESDRIRFEQIKRTRQRLKEADSQHIDDDGVITGKLHREMKTQPTAPHVLSLENVARGVNAVIAFVGPHNVAENENAVEQTIRSAGVSREDVFTRLPNYALIEAFQKRFMTVFAVEELLSRAGDVISRVATRLKLDVEDAEERVRVLLLFGRKLDGFDADEDFAGWLESILETEVVQPTVRVRTARKLMSAFAIAAGVLLLIAAFGWSYGQNKAAYAETLQERLNGLVQQYQSIRNRLGLDNYVEFSTAQQTPDARPRLEPDLDFPVHVVGKNVVVKGTVKTDLVDSVEVDVTPRFSGPTWPLTVKTRGRDEVEPFYLEFTPPTDNQRRRIQVTWKPTAKGKEVGIRTKCPEVTLACYAAGPIAYAPRESGPEIVDVKVSDSEDNATVTVMAKSDPASWITIALAAGEGGADFLPWSPKQVNQYGELQTFNVTLSPRSYRKYTLKAFAIVDGTPDDLTTAIKNEAFAGLLVGTEHALELKDESEKTIPEPSSESDNVDRSDQSDDASDLNNGPENRIPTPSSESDDVDRSDQSDYASDLNDDSNKGIPAPIFESDKDNRTNKSDSVARFAENNPDEVKGHLATVKALVDKELLDKRDVWFAFQPVQAPDQLWLQGTKVSNTNPVQVVYLRGIKTNELFQVHLISCPQGTITKDGPVPVSALKKFGIEILDTIIIHRTE